MLRFLRRGHRFPVELLVPVSGRIGPLLFKGDAGIALFHEIEIKLAPFDVELWEDGEAETEEVDTEFCFNFIQLPGPFSGYQALGGSRHTFPVNPRDGYIDGSIYIGFEHVPADATELAFGDYQNGMLSLHATVNLEFRASGHEFRSAKKLTLDATLSPEHDLAVDPELVQPTEDHRGAAIALLSRFVDLDAFEAPVIQDQRGWVISAKRR